MLKISLRSRVINESSLRKHRGLLIQTVSPCYAVKLFVHIEVALTLFQTNANSFTTYTVKLFVHIKVELTLFQTNTISLTLYVVTSPLSLSRDSFITLDLNDFFSSTNAELCLSPMKFDRFPPSGFQGLNLFVVFHQHFCSSQHKVLLTM